MTAQTDLFKHWPTPCAKKSYGSKREAKLALRTVTSIRRKQSAQVIERHPYHCPKCGRYHLTNLSHQDLLALVTLVDPQRPVLCHARQGLYE